MSQDIEGIADALRGISLDLESVGPAIFNLDIAERHGASFILYQQYTQTCQQFNAMALLVYALEGEQRQGAA
jgi:hypothetical protein